jgi:hypothetical protein
VKVLWLATSDDAAGDIPVEGRAYFQVVKLVEEAIGEPVEVVPRIIWPAATLPELIERWVERYRPDVVIYHVNGFWYLYRSTPLRLERKLGPLGKPLARAGLRAGGSAWFARTRVFHAGRWLALKTIGGDTYFSPDQVADTVEACVRRIVQHEGVGLVVRGPMAPWSWTSQPEGALRRVHERLAGFCAAVHVPYVAVDPDEPPDARMDFWGAGDRLHSNAAGHTWYARIDAEAIVTAWRQTRHE